MISREMYTQQKNMYRKILWLIIIVFLTGCQNNYEKPNLKSEIYLEENVRLETTFKEGCEYQTEIYFQTRTQEVYLNCIDSIDVIEGQNKISLKDYLDTHNSDIDSLITKVISNLTLTDNTDDNLIYKDKDMVVYVCEEYDGTQEIVVGNIEGKDETNLYCTRRPKNFYITARITEVFDDDIIVESIGYEKQIFTITRTGALEKNLLEHLKVGTTIGFTFTGNTALSNPPQIKASEIRIID